MPSAPDSIVCKPTPWFIFRALVLLAMFGVFAVLFYIDGSSGYRRKNEVFFLHRAFEQASKEFSQLNSEGALTPNEWKSHAASRSVDMPEDRSILPATVSLPMPWPEILHDFDRMRPLDWKKLWLEYSKIRGFDADPPEQPYDARKIGEQWVVFCICLALSSAALFILLRTLRRTISVDGEAIVTQQGKRVSFADLKKLDLRKWETKGLAFIDYEGPSGKGRIRLDGLTYGGFKKEQGEPAERLMRHIRARFSGEVLEYAPLMAEPAADDGQQGSV
jgi:hypothetical protein